MPNTYRVEKRSLRKRSAPHKGKGRPVQWSESWQKRLIMLRLCGLQPSEIGQILHIFSGGKVPDGPRRPQQILRELFPRGYDRYCAADKLTARRRVSFLKGLRPHKSRPMKCNQDAQASRRSFSLGASYRMSTTTPLKRSMSSVPLPSDRRWWSDYASSFDERSSNSIDRLPSNHPGHQDETTLNDTTASLHHIPSTVDRSSFRRILSGKTMSMLAATFGKGRLSYDSERSAKIRAFLRSSRHSSSYVSDIVSLLRRLSFCTASTSSRISVDAMSVPEGFARRDSKTEPESLQAIQEHRHKEANADIARKCCSTDSRCFHRVITALALMEDRDRTDHYLRENNNSTKVLKAIHTLNNCDRYGNTGLFFAARSGAPMDIILQRLDTAHFFLRGYFDTNSKQNRKIDVHKLNRHGQNFLFALDPEGLTDIMALIAQLEEREFNFRHTDHEGRSFLTYLVSQTSSPLKWILDLYARNESWSRTIIYLGRKRDCCGKTLIDYLIPRKDISNPEMLDTLRTLLQTEPWSPSQGPTLLQDEDWNGRILDFDAFKVMLYLDPELENYRQVYGETLNKQLAYQGPNAESFNFYDIHGYTIYLELIRYAANIQNHDEFNNKVPKLLTDLKSWGFNVNARLKDGSNAMHLATKSANPELVQLLVDLGVDFNHQDNAGDTALDYAIEKFNDSRKSSSPAKDVATTLRCITILVDHDAPMTFTSGVNGTIMLTPNGNNILIPDLRLEEASIRGTESVLDMELGGQENMNGTDEQHFEGGLTSALPTETS